MTHVYLEVLFKTPRHADELLPIDVSGTGFDSLHHRVSVQGEDDMVATAGRGNAGVYRTQPFKLLQVPLYGLRAGTDGGRNFT